MLATNNQTLSSVVDYKKLILTAVSDLQKLRDFSQTIQLSKSVELIDEIFQQIDAKSVVGETSNNNDWLTQDRFFEFEKTLELFLSQEEEHGAILLQVLINRILASSTEILKALNLQENAWQMRQDQFHQAYETSVVAIASLQTRKTEELAKIDEAAKQVKPQVQALVLQLPKELKKVAKQAIDSTHIRPEELKDTKALTEKLGHKVSDEIQKTGDKLSEQIQSEVQRGFMQEVERLQDFAGALVQTMQRIEMEFVQVGLKNSHQENVGETLVTTASAVANLRNILSGYQLAGLKGAVFGSTGTIGSMGVGIVKGAFGLAMTWPILIAIGVLSTVAANWIFQTVLGGFRVDKFRKDYKTQVLKEIDKQLKKNSIAQQVNDHIDERFSALKQQVHQEVEALLNNTQKTLVELQKQRQQTLTEKKHQQLDDMRTETQRILDRAQLMQIKNEE
jgi:hypothetical protein